MDDAKGDSGVSAFDLLDSQVAKIVKQLNDCRKENELLRSEIASLQTILRSCKLPVSGKPSADHDEGGSAGFSYTEKLQVRQKLVLILQKIEMELRDDSLQ
ncbi:conserved hypothetical protein [Prosthecochloris aestuarii DSM 271]|uniref:Uncharacterized protein n=1 Tax=Prosthecochloris aestuarii (strain DSM 271 / SK 413) TaxID=290512 RepID=B4S725_PROA2|nr:hypothetical protein [Prosthecochloris aestuarii]ACF45862.1 conserved hypothetical protein [Prosthecochloris aestuarii DSM 271]